MGYLRIEIHSDEVIDEIDTDDLISELAKRKLSSYQRNELALMWPLTYDEDSKMQTFLGCFDRCTVDQFDEFAKSL